MLLKLGLGMSRSFTIIEGLVILAVILLLAGLAPLAMQKQRQTAQLKQCEKNLRSIGLAFKTWSVGSSDAFVMKVEAQLGGSLEAVTNTEVFRHFQVLSNELGTPNVLVCPADIRAAASDFGSNLSNHNLSYFVGVDAEETYPQTFLSGDRNLWNEQLPPNHLVALTSNSIVGWNREIHRYRGNILLADGSVQRFDTRVCDRRGKTPKRLSPKAGCSSRRSQNVRPMRRSMRLPAFSDNRNLDAVDRRERVEEAFPLFAAVAPNPKLSGGGPKIKSR